MQDIQHIAGDSPPAPINQGNLPLDERPCGHRIWSTGHHAAQMAALTWAGLPEGYSSGKALLRDAQKCGEDLPFPRCLLPLLYRLLEETRQSDWEPTGSPVVCMTNNALSDDLGCSVRTVQVQLNRAEALGLIYRFDDGDRGWRQISLAPLAEMAIRLRSIARERRLARSEYHSIGKRMRQALARIKSVLAALSEHAGSFVAERCQRAVLWLQRRADAVYVDAGSPWRYDRECLQASQKRLDRYALLAEDLAAYAFREIHFTLSGDSPRGETGCTPYSYPNDSKSFVEKAAGHDSSFANAALDELPEQVRAVLAWQQDVVPPAKLVDTSNDAPRTDDAVRRLVYKSMPALAELFEEHFGRAPHQASLIELLALANRIRANLFGISESVFAQFVGKHGISQSIMAVVQITVLEADPAWKWKVSPVQYFKGMLRAPSVADNPDNAAALRAWRSLHKSIGLRDTLDRERLMVMVAGHAKKMRAEGRTNRSLLGHNKPPTFAAPAIAGRKRSGKTPTEAQERQRQVGLARQKSQNWLDDDELLQLAKGDLATLMRHLQADGLEPSEIVARLRGEIAAGRVVLTRTARRHYLIDASKRRTN